MSISQQKELLQDNYELLLFDYAAGNLDPAQNMIVLSHTLINADAKARVEAYEAAGAALMASHTESALSMNALESVFEKIDTYAEAKTAVQNKPLQASSILPAPIADALKMPLEQLPWRHVVSGVDKVDIKFSRNTSYTELLKIEPGKKIAPHSHEGEEITLVLDGSFEDSTGTYRRGDLIVADASVTHAPHAGMEKGCICVTARTAPLHFKGIMSLLNPFLKR